MRMGDSLRAWVGRSVQSTAVLIRKSRRAAIQQQLANAARCGIEPLETRTMLYAGTPYLGTPVSLPGTVQDVNFDLGGEGVAYHNPGDQNQGGAYRPSEGVGISASGDTGGGYDVGWTSAGEWLKYTVNAQYSGIYDFTFRVASDGNGGVFQLADQNSDNLTGELTVPNTGSWSTYTNIAVNDVFLTAGTQVLTLDLQGVGATGTVGNFNYFTATYPAQPTRLYWDPAGAANASGGSGTWDTTTAEWRSGSPTGSLVAWSNSGDANGPYQAVFPSGGGTVTLGASVSAEGLSFTAPNTTLVGGSGADVLTLAGSQVDVAAGSTATISAQISAPSGLYKTSGGTLNLTGTVTGGSSSYLDVEQGSVAISGSESWGAAEISSAGMLIVQGSGASLVASGGMEVDGLVDHYGGSIQTPALYVDGGAVFSDWAGSISGTSGGVTIDNTGLFDSVNDQSLAGTSGQFNNSGIYEVDNATGSGTTTLSLIFTDTWGTIDVASGTLSIPDSIYVVGNSTMTLDGAGTLALPSLDYDQATIVQNSGVVSIAGGLEIGDQFYSGASYVLTGGSLDTGSMGLGCYSTATFNQSGGSFYSWLTGIGASGNGTYVQTGGTSTFGNQLFVGQDGVGTFELLGGSSSQGMTVIGQTDYNTGVGTFIQSGGTTNTVGTLIVGHFGSVNSVYKLQGGTLNVQSEYVGINGNATGAAFIQTGGTQTVSSSIDLADGSGCTASYNISGGSLTASNLFIGQNGGQSVYEQTGGNVSLSGVLLGGVHADGTTVLLSGGTLSVGQSAYVGYTSPATFNQTGGTFSVTDDLIMSGDEIAQDPAGNGTFLLSGNAHATASRVFVGYSANGSLLMSGGTLTTNALVLNGPAGTIGTFNQTGGTLAATNTINILKPTASGASLANEGSPYILGLSATSNYGNNAITSWGLLWGDGTSSTAPGSANAASHTYYIGGQTYTINATAYSNGDSFASSPVSVLVNDLPATIAPIASQSVNTGSPLSVSTTFTDPGTGETHSALIYWGDGTRSSVGAVVESNGTGTITGSHTYAAHGTYTATMYVTDSAGAMAVITFPVTAVYVAPVVSIVPPTTPPVAGQSTTIQLQAIDPEAGLIQSWTVQWGDGSTQTFNSSNATPTVSGSNSVWNVTHTYASPGSYSIQATATDAEGSYVAQSQAVALPGLAIDIRGANGSSSATVTHVGQVIPLQVWAVATGTNLNGASDAISSFAGSFISSMASATSVHGNLSDSGASFNYDFAANGAQLGTQQNLNGDGNLDIGSDDGSSIAGYFNARAGGMVTGTVIGASDEILIATIDYTVTSLSSGGETDINFFPRPVIGTGYAAVWQQDGQAENETTSTFAGGAPFRINAGPQPVVPPTQPSIIPDVLPGGGNNPPSLTGTTVVALTGSGNFSISLASGQYQFEQGTTIIASVSAANLEGFTFTGGGNAASLTVSGAGANPVLLNDAGSDGTSLVVTVDAGSGITFNTTEHLSSLTIESGATATMADNGQSVLVTNSLSLAGSLNAWTGTLDLTNDGLIVNGGSLATITNQLKEGYNGGDWNGLGIDSTSATANGYINALGVVSNQISGTTLYSTFDGQAVTSSDILVQYTYYGDLDLNGQVDGNDYSLIDNAYAKGGLTGWMNGDINYDGFVDGSDYTLVDNAFNQQGAPIINPGTGVLPAPRNLTATTISSTQINLSWIDDASSTDAPDDTIYESTNDGSFIPIQSIASVAAGSTNSYQVSGLTTGDAYQFYVEAGGGAASESGPSNTVDWPLVSVPPGWSETDVDLTQGGATAASAGSSVYNALNDTSTVTTPDVSGDSLLSFDGQSFDGNGSLEVEVTSVSTTTPAGTTTPVGTVISAGAGLMIEDQANSSFVYLMDDPQGNVWFGDGNFSNWAGAGTEVTNGMTGPLWLSLSRTANGFDASYSTDGTNWVTAENQVSLPSGILSDYAQAGIAVANGLQSWGTSGAPLLGVATGQFAGYSSISVVPSSPTSADIQLFSSWSTTNSSIIKQSDDTTPTTPDAYTQVGVAAAGATDYTAYGLNPNDTYSFEIENSQSASTLFPVGGLQPTVNTNVTQYSFTLGSSGLNNGNGDNPWSATGVTAQRTSVWADNESDAAEDLGIQINFQYIGGQTLTGSAAFPPTPHLMQAGNLEVPTDANGDEESLAAYSGMPADQIVDAWGPGTYSMSGSSIRPDVEHEFYVFGGSETLTKIDGNDCNCPPNPPAQSGSPVYYSDGVADEGVTDLQSSGYGINWGVTRNWTNQAQSAMASGIFGNSTDEEQLSRVVVEGNSVGVATDGASIFWFDPGPNGTYVSRFGNHQTLAIVHTARGLEWLWTDSSGDATLFYTNGLDEDQMDTFTDPGGDTATANYGTLGQLQSVVIQSPGIAGSEKYIYSDGPSGQLSSIELEQVNGSAVTPVQTVVYIYYPANDIHGNAGDLELAQVFDGGTTTGTPISTDYYRYYAPIQVTEEDVSTSIDLVSGGPDPTTGQYNYTSTTTYTLDFPTTALGLTPFQTSAVVTLTGTGIAGQYYVSTPQGDTGASITFKQFRTFTSEEGGLAGQTDQKTTVNSYSNPPGVTVLANGNKGDLQYVFEGQSFAQLVQGLNLTGLTTTQMVTQLDQETNSAVAQYAGNFFQYDSENRVTLEEPQGAGASARGNWGRGYISYSYAENVYGAGGPNSWANETVETVLNSYGLAFGVNNIVFTNSVGEVLLNDAYGSAVGYGALDSATGYQYGDSSFDFAQLTKTIEQSALTDDVTDWIYWDENPTNIPLDTSVINFNRDNSGLIETISYYPTTTATGNTPGTDGGVAGYEASTGVEDGPSGPVIEQESFTYYLNTVYNSGESVTIYPTATDTLYTDNPANGSGAEAGTGEETTTYTYTFYSGTNAIKEMDTAAPVISAAENGPGVADVERTVYDPQGWTVWTMDGDGFIDYTAYDYPTGSVTTQIDDVNLADTGDYSSTCLPTTWTTPFTGGFNLVTTDVVDAQGRDVEEISPQGNITYTVYEDAVHEVITFNGWNTSTNAPTTPTEVYFANWGLSYDETLTTSAAPIVVNGVPTGIQPVTSSNLESLTVEIFDLGGQEIEEDDYTSLGSNPFSQFQSQLGGSAATANSSGNYDATTYQYDADGRLTETTDPGGTITQTVYDGIGQVISTFVGTSDGTGSAPSNLVDVEDDYYDGNTPDTIGNPIFGDGNLTEVVDHTQASNQSTDPDQVTAYFYDWQDRQVGELDGGRDANDPDTGGDGAILYVSQYDEQGEDIVDTQFAAGGSTFVSADFVGTYVPPGAGQSLPNGLVNNEYADDLRAEGESLYDDQGRVYQSNVFSVEPLTGSDPGEVGTAVTTNLFYDHRGDEIAVESPTGLWTKSDFNGEGLLVEQDQTNGAGGSTWAAASSIANDVVFSQMLYSYDGDDNLIETTDKERLNGDSATAAGPLGGAYIPARISFTASFYDQADRDFADANVGTNNGTNAWSSGPTTIAALPAGSQVTSYVYDAAGHVQFVTDPKEQITYYGYDLLGQTTVEVANWVNGQVGPVYTGSLPSPTDSTNQTTRYIYNGNGDVISMTAEVAPSEGETEQVTDYVYGVTTAQGSAIDDNDLLQQVQYPDPTSGQPSGTSQDETHTYDALGNQLTYTDRNGTEHGYTYDDQGRLTADTILHFASGVDQTVTSLGYTYDDAGNLSTATSYNGTTPLNQVQYTYDGLGQETAEAQAHDGTVATDGSTPTVGYTYDSSNGDRLTGMTYPNGRTINYNYNGNSGLDSTASRISSITDSNGSLIQSYQYQGQDTPMVSTSGNGVVGTTVLDSLGRVQSLTYTNGSGTVIDGYSYTYDADNNVTSKTQLAAAMSGDSETYTYDGLNRLETFKRGTISNGTIASPTTSESWSLDALGNQTSVTLNGVVVSRAVNNQNQIQSLSNSTTNLNYDANGNTLNDQTGQTYTYDAWNHLVSVTTPGGDRITYKYDALGRVIAESDSSTGTTTDLYYSSSGQVIEERVNGIVTQQYVWSPFYVNQLVERDTYSGGVFSYRLYAEQDADYNVTSLTNSSGAVVERYVYDPYGAIIVLNASGSVLGTGLSSSTVGQQFGFQGGWTVPRTGLTLFGARWLTSNGTWLNQDPTGSIYINGPDLYQVEKNNSLGSIDPTGLDDGSTYKTDGAPNGIAYYDAPVPGEPSNVVRRYYYQYSFNWGFGGYSPVGSQLIDKNQGFGSGAVLANYGMIPAALANAATNIEIAAGNVGELVEAYLDASSIVDGAALVKLLGDQGYKLAVVGGKKLLIKGGKTLAEDETKEALRQAAIKAINKKVNKAVNSDIEHAAERTCERGVMTDKNAAKQALKDLSKDITKNGLPPGTIPDPKRADSVLVPFNGGWASYELKKNGTLILRTVIGATGE